jgi:hypothetical protein
MLSDRHQVIEPGSCVLLCLWYRAGSAASSHRSLQLGRIGRNNSSPLRHRKVIWLVASPSRMNLEPAQKNVWSALRKRVIFEVNLTADAGSRRLDRH